MKKSFQKLRVGSYRLAVFFTLVAALVYGSRSSERTSWDADRVLKLSQEVFPQAAEIGPLREGVAELLMADSELVGYAATTSPQADSVIGYAGATNTLVVFTPDWRVAGMRVVSSQDTASHLKKVVLDRSFWEQWFQQPESDLPREVSVVSGATLTSEAIAKGIRARFADEQVSGHYAEVPQLATIQEVFPEIARFLPIRDRKGAYKLFDEQGQRQGTLLRSGNQAGQPRGFNGASDVWVFLDEKEELIVRVFLVESRDNEPYLSDVREELKWSKELKERTVSEFLADDQPVDQVLVVSGATVTSRALSGTVRKLLRDYQRPIHKKRWWQARDTVLVLWVALALLLGYSRWKGSKWLRWGTEVTAILVGGLWLGVMVGMGSLVSWSRGEVPWASFPGLVLLAGVALLVPVATGKNSYCAKLCAHGAAQGVVFRLTKWRWVPKARWHKVMKWIPILTLVSVFLLAAAGFSLDFSSWEPFDVWSVGLVAVIPVIILCVGLLASLFIPKAYCKYGCPTGFLLDQLASSRNRFRRKDWFAGGLALLCWAFVLARGMWG